MGGIQLPALEDFEPFSIDETEQSLAEAFDKAARKYSERIAIHTDEEEISYRELDGLTDHLAQRIVELLGDEEEPVAVLVEQGASQLIAMLSVLKAGNIYAVMDLANPPERLSAMIRDLGSRLTITGSAHASLAASVSGSSVTILEMDKLTVGDKKVLVHRSSEATAAVYYTSGSTGQPKGVIRAHRDILHNPMIYVNFLGMNKEDRQPLFFSCSFAMSIRPVFSTILRGGTIYPFDLKKKDIRELPSWLDQNKITVIGFTPSLLRQFMESLSKDKRHFPTLRFIITIGEPLQVQDVKHWQGLFYQGSLLCSSLGSTEAGLITSRSFRYDDNITEENLHVGYPVLGKEVLIVDDEHRPLPIGQQGEITIRSKFLSAGYWNQPELTEAVFQRDALDPAVRIYYSNDLGRILPDGSLEHLGRKDSKVKIRGYLVDMREVEYALYETLPIKSAAVSTCPARHDPHQSQLVAYLVPKDEGLMHNDVRDLLAAKLPSYMIPSHFMFLDKIPVTANGKVDKRALPQVGERTALLNEERPSDDVEEMLVNIWRRIFKLRVIGVHDNFFDLGGDSLLAMSLLLSIEKTFSRKMPYTIISKASTIRQQAEILRSEKLTEYTSVLIPIQTSGDKKPIYCIGGKGGLPIRFNNLLKYMSRDQPIYFFRSRGYEPGEIVENKIEDIAADYLREVKRVQPSGPYSFFGESSGGLVAYEMAQQLYEQGEETAFLGMLDTYSSIRASARKSVLKGVLTLAGKHMQTLVSGGFGGLQVYIKYYLELGKFKFHQFQAWVNEKKNQLRFGDMPYVFSRVDEANMIAVRAYNPKPYHGAVVLFRALRQAQFDGQNQENGWREIGVGNLIVHALDCYHGNILFEPFVQQVAEKVNQYLSRPVGSAS